MPLPPPPRCLNTATNVLKGLPLNATNVEELARETLGEDTCDARRSVTDPQGGRQEGAEPRGRWQGGRQLRGLEGPGKAKPPP
jgi:hypothetical protein